MDALHPRLLVTRFAETYRFYSAVLPELCGAVCAKGSPHGPYAHWDVDGEGLLSMFARDLMATAVKLPDSAPGNVILVLRVTDVDAALVKCEDAGASVVTPATDRPQWGPGLRTAHLRDPDGNLVELQSY